jgi:hypothetical protein
VRVTWAAICGSDLHLYHGMMPDPRVDMTFGHEFVGVVARGLYSNCHNVTNYLRAHFAHIRGKLDPETVAGPLPERRAGCWSALFQ